MTNEPTTPNAAFRLSCGCGITALDISLAGFVRCPHGRTLFVPAFVDFVRGQQPLKRETGDRIGAAVNELCIDVAADVLAKDLDIDESIFDFALATIRKPLRSENTVNHKEIREIEKALAPLVHHFEAVESAQAEARAKNEAEVKAAAEFLEKFLRELCNLPTVPVINGRKSPKEKMFDTLHHALIQMSLESEPDADDPNREEYPWENFAEAVGRAGIHIDFGEHNKFRRAMIDAFWAAAQHPNFSMIGLANEIRNAKYLEQERRLRLKIELRALGCR
jgi:hypothetical protein